MISLKEILSIYAALCAGKVLFTKVFIAHQNPLRKVLLYLKAERRDFFKLL